MKIELVCEICGKKFERRAAEDKRNKQKGRRVYCSLRCVGKGSNAHLAPWQKQGVNLLTGGDTQSDEFSPFRMHMKCIHNRANHGKRKECFVTLEDLKNQWDAQCGICPFTGWAMKQPKNTSKLNCLPKTPNRASLDRIDSSKPYTKDNIQFISLMAQYAKNSWDGQELLDFCRAVAQNRG